MRYYIFEDSSKSRFSKFIELGMPSDTVAIFASSNVLLQSKLDEFYNYTIQNFFRRKFFVDEDRKD